MELASILTELKKPFPAADHKERKIPGGGRWVYLPWTTIRDRLEQILPLDWQVEFSDPVVAGDYTVIRCRLTILLSQKGIVREGVGNDKAYPELNESGRAKTIGTPIERATADAFKNAAEQFGLGAYLDDQKFVARYLQSQGDGRGVKFLQENTYIEAGAMGVPKVDDRRKLINDTNVELDRLNWNTSQGRACLQEMFGKQARSELSIAELHQFLEYLKSA